MKNRKITLPLVLAAATAGIAGCGGSGGADSRSLTGGGGSTTPGTTTQSTFTQVGSLGTGRVFHSATYIPTVKKVLVAGGIAKAGTTQVVLDSAELFDPATGAFTPTQGRLAGARTTGNNGRAHHAGIALPTGKVVIAGGQTDVAGNSALNSLEIFDAASTSAQFGTVSGNLTEAKAEPIAFAYNGSSGTTEIAIVGGRRGSGTAATPLRSANFYRGDSNSILSQTANLGLARFGGRAQPMSSAANAEWVIAGGIARASGASANSVAGFEVFDPQTRTFKSTNRTSTVSNSSNFQNRHSFDAAILGSAVALFGGNNAIAGTTGALDSVEFYNEQTNSWTSITARLNTPRQGHTVTRLSNGSVVVIGGFAANGQVLGSAELVAGSGVNATVQQLGAVLRTPRKNHSATVIQIGSTEAILIVGGEDASGNPVAAAEVFAPNTVTVPVPQPPIGAQAPTLTQLVPSTGPVGTAVTIKGTNFSTVPGSNVVTFGGILAPVQSVVSGELRVLVPQGAPAQSDVVVKVNGLASNSTVFVVTSGTGSSSSTSSSGGGTQFNGPPRIFILLPSSGPGFMPLGIGGTNFDRGTVPYVNSVPSVAIFNFSIRNIPLLGSISVGFTIVPPAAPSGPGDVMVEYNGQQSNRFPFTVN